MRQVRRVRPESVVYPGLRGNAVRQVRRVRPESVVYPGHKGNAVRQVRRVRPESVVYPGHKGNAVRQVRRVRPESVVYPGRPEWMRTGALTISSAGCATRLSVSKSGGMTGGIRVRPGSTSTLREL